MRHRAVSRGFTLAELVTALVVAAILAAVAVPLWRVHLLRVRRAEATAALIAIQAAQDRYFGHHARYAEAGDLTRAAPEGLGQAAHSAQGSYDLALRTSDDGLGYLAIARASRATGQSDDARCTEFTLDHNNRRRATDAGGHDRSADCWR
jgi:type IV pilus assembly protein PilE